MKYIIFCFLFCHSLAYANIGDDILAHYQSRLYRLPYVQQEHFSIRMYTLTGDERYLNPVVVYLYLLSTKFKAITRDLDNNTMIDDENRRLLSVSDSDTDKKKLRVKKIERADGIAFYMNYLILVKKIHFYKLEKTPLFPEVDTALNYLKAKEPDFERFLLDKESIKLYGAQLINYVYYLHELDIVDLRERYARSFRKVFPDSKDDTLSSLDYAAKIYGMTHFIIAASDYYQTNPTDPSLNWITGYFEAHVDEIIKRTENDVIAEVGVCLMLAGKQHSPAVSKIREYLEKAYDSKLGLIPAKDGSADLAQGEHRNILAIMLFKWPEKRTRIPDAMMQKLFDRGFALDGSTMKIHFGFNLI